jgi:cyclophilin family peptidyl-prolyl cis-trans isomerase
LEKLTSILIIFLLMVAPCVWAQSSNPRVRVETNKGVILLELDPQAAPKTVENFLRYVSDGFYDGTIFHRVIKGFMIQGGGLTAEMQEKPTRDSIANEAENGLKNRRGTVAMARTADPHSATAQFFINSEDNSFLDHKGKTANDWGYCVFGRIVEGMEIVDSIERLPTTVKAGHRDVPVSSVIIERAVLLK